MEDGVLVLLSAVVVKFLTKKFTYTWKEDHTIQRDVALCHFPRFPSHCVFFTFFNGDIKKL